MSTNGKEIRISASLELWVKITLIMANCAIFLGIGFAVIQYLHAVSQFSQAERFNTEQRERAITFEKTKNAIDAVNKVYNSEFINSLAKLKGTNTLKNNEVINALNLVFNTYSEIAIVYNNNIADNKIITGSIKKEVVKFVNLPIFINSYTDEEKSEINKMVNNINNGG